MPSRRNAVYLAIADPALADRLREQIAGDPDLRLLPEDASLDQADVAVLGEFDPGLDAPTVLVTEEPAAIGLLREGAGAVLPPDVAARELRAAIHAVAAGLLVLTEGGLEDEAREDGWDEPAEEEAPAGDLQPKAPLTPREVEVLALLLEGASNKLIARRLAISFHTAKFHVASLLAKLGARSRSDAVAQGLRQGHIML